MGSGSGEEGGSMNISKTDVFGACDPFDIPLAVLITFLAGFWKQHI